MSNRKNTERLLMSRVIVAYMNFGYGSQQFDDAMTAFGTYTELDGTAAEKYCLQVADEFIKEGELMKV